MSVDEGTDLPPHPAVRIGAGKNPERSRSHNRRVLLELLRRNGPLGRKALADLAEISTQAVTNIIDDLMAEGLLTDLGRRRQGRGLPPIQYAINPGGGFAIGVEIAVGALAVAVLDLGGNILHEERIDLRDMRPEPVLATILAMVARLRAAQPAQLMGIGVVMPGPFGIEGLSDVGPTTLAGWDQLAVAGQLSRATGVAVLVDNDANAAAVGEFLFGKGLNVPHFCLIYFGAGIGLGAIVQDQPLRGAFGNAGEIGHVVIAPGGRPCQCGQAGCLERYASVHALSEQVGRGDALLPPEAILALHRAGDPRLAGWIDTAARHLSAMIGLIENIFDPQTVILAGKIPGPVLDDLIARLSLPASVANRRGRSLPRVQRGQTGAGSAALGAAALPLFNAIAPQVAPVGEPAVAPD